MKKKENTTLNQVCRQWRSEKFQKSGGGRNFNIFSSVFFFRPNKVEAD